MGNRATIKDVAVKAGVSPAAVSKAFKGDNDISQETKDKIFKIAKELNYIPNEFAVNLVKKVNNFIGIVLPVFKDTLFSDILDGIYKYLEKNNYSAFIYLTWGNKEKEIEVIDYLIRKNVAGVILFSLFSKIKSIEEIPHILELKNRKIPYVLIDRNIILGNHNFIGVNNFKGGKIIGEYLRNLNHKNIIFLYGEDCTTVDERFEGIKSEFLKNKHNNIIKWSEIKNIAYETGYKGVESILRNFKLNESTTIVCASDSIAMGAYKKLEEVKIKVPEDISLIGFDNLFYSQLINLTTISYNREELGKKSAYMLLNNKNNWIEYLEPSLVIRKSVKRM